MAVCLLRLSAVAALWLSVALTAHPAPGQVPAPFNLSVFSYNFNTTLHWSYSRPAASPYFQLEIWNRGNRSWDVIEHCRKILHRYCDLSYEITEPFTFYKVRVKAIAGAEESNYTKTEINLISAGIIGPPSVNGSIQDGVIIIDIWHPEVPSVHKKKTITDYGEFNYIVYYGNTTEEVDDCDNQACSAEIHNIDPFCFFVQGRSQDLPMTIEKSEKICISGEEKGLEESSSGLTYTDGLKEFSSGQTYTDVPAPFNLTVTSYNFNTTLHWKYSRPSNSAYFMVEILKHGEKHWTVIEHCRNIFQHHCDLSLKIIDPMMYYKARVKAIVDNKESNYTLIEFALVNIGVIGPPSVNGSIQDKTIVIDIWHPRVPSVHGRKTVLDYAQFNYIVYYGNIIEETDDCDNQGCSAEILIKDQLFCFYVQGKSQELPITTERSQRICIHNEEKGSSLQAVVITVLIVIGILLLMFFIGYWIHRKVTKGKNNLPQSLSSVVRNLASHIHILPQYTQTYANVSTTPIESPVEQKTIVEEEQVTIDVSAQSMSNGSAYPPYQSSLAENDLKTEENVEGANSSNSNFPKDSDNSNNSLEPKTEENITKQEPKPEPPRDVKIVLNSFGYDKPHFPKELV